MLLYEGREIHKIHMTEPSVIQYEVDVMEQYQQFLFLLKEKRFHGMDLNEELDYVNT